MKKIVLSEKTPLSHTMKIVQDNTKALIEATALLLSADTPRDVDALIVQMDNLAHERLLAIQFEAARIGKNIDHQYVVENGDLVPVGSETTLVDVES